MYPEMRQDLLLEVQKRLAGEENLDCRQVTEARKAQGIATTAVQQLEMRERYGVLRLDACAPRWLRAAVSGADLHGAEAITG